MLGFFNRPAPEAVSYQVDSPRWLDDIELLIVDFECLVTRFAVPEFALRQDLRDYCQRNHWRRLEFDPIGPDIRRLRDTLGWTAYRDALQILERWELRAAPHARPDRNVWRILLDFHLDGGLIAIVGDHTQLAMRRTVELLDTAFMVDMIVGSDDVDRAKPDPTMLVAVKQATGLPRERMLHVGRGRTDLSMAQRADLPYRDYRRSFAPTSQRPASTAAVTPELATV